MFFALFGLMIFMLVLFYAKDVRGKIARQDCNAICNIYKNLEKETGEEYVYNGYKWELKTKK